MTSDLTVGSLDTGKVVQMQGFRSGKSLSPIRQVEAYWTALREGGSIPRRTQIDPRAFIDDDEIAGPHWISTFADEAVRTSADCLFAPVEPHYAPDTSAWIVHLNPLFPEEVRR